MLKTTSVTAEKVLQFGFQNFTENSDGSIDGPVITDVQQTFATWRHLKASARCPTRAKAARPGRDEQPLAAGRRVELRWAGEEDAEDEEDEREEAGAQSGKNIERHLARVRGDVGPLQRSRRFERHIGQAAGGRLHPGNLVAVFLLPLLHQLNHQSGSVRTLQCVIQAYVRQDLDLQVDVYGSPAVQPILLRIIKGTIAYLVGSVISVIEDAQI